MERGLRNDRRRARPRRRPAAGREEGAHEDAAEEERAENGDGLAHVEKRPDGLEVRRARVLRRNATAATSARRRSS